MRASRSKVAFAPKTRSRIPERASTRSRPRRGVASCLPEPRPRCRRSASWRGSSAGGYARQRSTGLARARISDIRRHRERRRRQSLRGRQLQLHHPEDRHRDRRRHHARDRIFPEPVGIAADGAGNVFVTSDGNSAIRKIAVATGTVTTLAGAPDLSYPRGIAYDGAGNLYVTAAATTPSRRSSSRQAPSPRSWRPMAASPEDFADSRRHSSSPTGRATSSSTNGTQIRKVVIATGAVSTLMDATALPVPGPLASDGAGNLFDREQQPDPEVRHRHRRRHHAHRRDGHSDRRAGGSRLAGGRGGQPLRPRHRQHDPEGRDRTRGRHLDRGRSGPSGQRRRRARRRPFQPAVRHRERRRRQRLRRGQLQLHHPEDRHRDGDGHHLRGRGGRRRHRGRNGRRRALHRARRPRPRRRGQPLRRR